MKSFASTALIALAILCLLLPSGARGNPFSFYGLVGEEFFDEETPNEASGLEIAPDRSHLIVVSDDGKIFFLNLLDYDSGHCVVDLDDDDIVDDRTDFEGVAIDTNEWSYPDNMYAYVVHEGGDDDAPYLFKIKYSYDARVGACSVTVVDERNLKSAIPCLEDSNGFESLTLKSPSTDDEPAVFYAGVQDTGFVYEITSDGRSNSGTCYDGGLGIEDLSASSFDGTYLWSYYGDEGKIAVVDVDEKDCLLASYDVGEDDWDKEGLVIDFENELMYVAVDNQGGNDPSLVAVYNFTYPDAVDLEACEDGWDATDEQSCPSFEVCGTKESRGIFHL